MKYVIVLSDLGSEQAIVFPDTLKHADVAYRFRNGKVKSAGFCSLSGEWSAWGDSESLGLESRGKADEDILNKCFSTRAMEGY